MEDVCDDGAFWKSHGYNDLAAAAAAAACNDGKNAPLRFAVIADVQYADIDDAYNFSKTSKRMYRRSLRAFQLAVQSWNSVHASKPISFVAQLGDLIDGQNKARGQSQGALDACMNIVAGSSISEWHHSVGNHELYNFPRSASHVPWSRPGASYYMWRPHPRVVAVQLDAYEISTIGRSQDDSRTCEAWRILNAHNPNDCKAFGVDWKRGLKGLQKRHVPYNGGLGSAQLAWFRTIVAQARQDGDVCVVFSHLPTFPDAATDDTLLFDFEQALAVLREYPSTVCAWFAGHQHAGGVSHDPSSGTLHYTLASPLESIEETCHAVVEILPRGDGAAIAVRGHGKLVSTAARISSSFL